MLHMSLNFDINEKVGKEKLQRIARAYMEKIGFDEQPCPLCPVMKSPGALSCYRHP